MNSKSIATRRGTQPRRPPTNCDFCTIKSGFRAVVLGLILFFVSFSGLKEVPTTIETPSSIEGKHNTPQQEKNVIGEQKSDKEVPKTIETSMSIEIKQENKQEKTVVGERELDKFTCDFVEKVCAEAWSIGIQMAAVPHTASSSTNRLFIHGRAAWNVTIPLENKGFDDCPTGSSLRTLPKCNSSCNVLGKLQYHNKQHATYEMLARRPGSVVFTVLREPEQQVISHYRARKQWDAMWEVQYPNGTGRMDATLVEWAEKAWWRHNLFTKMLGTRNAGLIWASVDPRRSVEPNEPQNRIQNDLGEKSEMLHIALRRLQTMPFFGLMHRMEESFELMCFHLCIPFSKSILMKKNPKKAEKGFRQVIDKYFQLDKLLLQKAEAIFDGLVEEMRHQQREGIVCNLASVLKASPGTTVGIGCVHD